MSCVTNPVKVYDMNRPAESQLGCQGSIRRTENRVMDVPATLVDEGADRNEAEKWDTERDKHEHSGRISISYTQQRPHPSLTRSTSAKVCWMEMSLSENSRLCPPIWFKTPRMTLGMDQLHH